MKKQIILIIIAVLLTFLGALGVGYNLQNKNKEAIPYENKTEADIIKNEEDSKLETPKDETQVIVDQESIDKVNKEQEQKKKENEKKEAKTTTESKKNNSTNNNQNNHRDNQDKSVEVKPSTQEKVIVSTETTTEENSEPYKYGVTLKEIKTYNVTTYSDGTIEKTLVRTSKSYDKSGFNATTSDMLSEAKSIASTNLNVYQDVLGYVNIYRDEVGINPLTLDNDMSVAATIRAIEMAYSTDNLKISHTRPSGTSCFTIFAEMGITGWSFAENIAAGYGSAASVSNGWKNSSGHYSNMINNSYSRIGVGMYQFNGTKYWVQLFAS